MRMDWREVLKTAKNARLEYANDSNAFFDCVAPYFHPCYEQFALYAKEMSCDKDNSTLSPDSIKGLVLQTRAALRFGLSCVSADGEWNHSEAMVATIQSKAMVDHRWYDPLSTILSRSRGDKKSRILAARLMSNLVTSNEQTASILSTNVRIAPSNKSVASSILDKITDKETIELPLSSRLIAESNWVDMFLFAAKSRNRDAFAAIAAVLHNCIASLLIKEHENRDIPFIRDVASNGMLINNLLRHFVSAEAITEALDNEKEDSKGGDGLWDSATEWIQLLLSKLAKLGMFPDMYSCIGAACDKTSPESAPIRILPEQNVLLQCMSREAEAYAMEFTSNNKAENPFGGEAGSSGDSYYFLADLAVAVSPWFRHERLQTSSTTTHDQDEQCSFNDTLLQSGFLTTNEILASTLGVDSALSATLRLDLGQKTSILQETAKSLGVVLDDLAEKSAGRKASDVHLTSDDQRLLVALVQFIGNLCYKCKHNQDLLRTTLVPPAKKPVLRVERIREEGNDPIPSGVRNGLHVLLTCTTHATSCFTLREWGVIAIRNALDDNANNQAVVEELMAQGPVESADLEQAGVRVQLDSKGKVSLTTINEK